jgi:hypothetical protein
MGGLLAVAEVPGFLGNRQEQRAEAERERGEWLPFLTAWWATYGGRPVTAGDLYGIARERRLLLDIWAGRTELGGLQRLGHALAGARDRIIGAYVVRSAGAAAGTHNRAYRLEEAHTAAPGASGEQTPQTPETPPSAEGATGVWGVWGVFNPVGRAHANGVVPDRDYEVESDDLDGPDANSAGPAARVHADLEGDAWEEVIA